MLSILFDTLFPRYCIFCKKKESYICSSCKKTFRRRLPECYICRRLSQDFCTHMRCRREYSLDTVYVAWEYNRKSSQILKKYKYTGVYDLGDTICDFLIENISLHFMISLRNSLLIPVPSSYTNYSERGFKQMDILVKELGQRMHLNCMYNFLKVRNISGHQSLRSKEQRYEYFKDIKYEIADIDLSMYSSITLVDDVITTGSTLNSICKSIKRKYKIPVYALCLFRGRAYYS